MSDERNGPIDAHNGLKSTGLFSQPNVLPPFPNSTLQKVKKQQRGLNDVLDEMDHFLTEIINQQWSLNQSSVPSSAAADAASGKKEQSNTGPEQPIVQISQTMFPRSKV